jgi:hypothetical protein
VDLELWVLFGQQIQFGFQQDVLLCNIGKDQINKGLVFWVLDDSADDLKSCYPLDNGKTRMNEPNARLASAIS